MASLNELKQQIQVVDWQALEPHLKRGGLFLVSSDIELETAGLALALNDVIQVEKWLQSASLTKLVPENTNNLEDTQGDVFRYLIIQPFVLVQLIQSS